MWPGRALAAGEAAPASPSGKRITLSMNADGLLSATGSTTGPTTSTSPRAKRPTARCDRRSRAAQAARKASGQAVNFREDAAPKASPATSGRRRCNPTRPASIRATTGMSSPPVASGSAAVGRTVSTCSARKRASVAGRRRLRAIRETTAVNTRNWMRASVRRASTLLPLEKPKRTMPGRYG